MSPWSRIYRDAMTHHNTTRHDPLATYPNVVVVSTDTPPWRFHQHATTRYNYACELVIVTTPTETLTLDSWARTTSVRPGLVVLTPAEYATAHRACLVHALVAAGASEQELVGVPVEVLEARVSTLDTVPVPSP